MTRTFRGPDLTGSRFNRLLVLSRHAREITRNGKINHRTYYKCVCDCGREKMVRSDILLSGKTQSCGCFHRDDITTHGMSHTPEHRAWSSIKSRCYNPIVKNYPDYGGRGIKMCARWLNSFENFLADMGRRPSDLHSVDRRDNNKGYDKKNCKWSTGKEQQNNKRNTSYLTFEGKTEPRSYLAKKHGITNSALSMRLRRGWDLETALNTPMLRGRS